ncbi:hypothetical protein BC936DRAFT_144903 [Jimgerdemannia flammicorona]|uniref:Uncharacterized protein n=1 Tax=Jimgerdemannia flammicorona TaxID=994334 RepID=A0A433DLZ1_9FUNG|nr:hypothetical protein BC936DRAFT_144903 [Jimgerdemannia flammicorona]
MHSRQPIDDINSDVDSGLNAKQIYENTSASPKGLVCISFARDFTPHTPLHQFDVIHQLQYVKYASSVRSYNTHHCHQRREPGVELAKRGLGGTAREFSRLQSGTEMRYHRSKG